MPRPLFSPRGRPYQRTSYQPKEELGPPIPGPPPPKPSGKPFTPETPRCRNCGTPIGPRKEGEPDLCWKLRCRETA
jgi:hypothetical protein